MLLGLLLLSFRCWATRAWQRWSEKCRWYQ